MSDSVLVVLSCGTDNPNRAKREIIQHMQAATGDSADDHLTFLQEYEVPLLLCTPCAVMRQVTGADPFKTGLESFKLDMRTFLLPYMFITAPQMLLIGLDPGIMGVLEASWIFITSSIGMYALAAGMQGFLIDDDTWFERILQKRRVGVRVAVAA